MTSIPSTPHQTGHSPGFATQLHISHNLSKDLQTVASQWANDRVLGGYHRSGKQASSLGALGFLAEIRHDLWRQGESF
jgi:hypothetical protein